MVDAIACRTSASTSGGSRLGAVLDEPEPQVDVAEEPPLDGRAEARPGAELARAADVVEQRGREQEVDAQPRMDLAVSRHSDATPTVCSSSPPA